MLYKRLPYIHMWGQESGNKEELNELPAITELPKVCQKQYILLSVKLYYYTVLKSHLGTKYFNKTGLKYYWFALPTLAFVLGVRGTSVFIFSVVYLQICLSFSIMVLLSPCARPSAQQLHLFYYISKVDYWATLHTLYPYTRLQSPLSSYCLYFRS